MTIDKARKRAVRTRMQKTGERYAAARRHVVADAARPAPLPPRVAEPGMSDDAIRKGSGRTWDDWFRILDGWGATKRRHRDIARHVHETYGVDGWWAQSVTVGYERARGSRAVNETPDGFQVSVSKTIPSPADAVWRAFVEPRQRNRWLPTGTLKVRTASRPRSARFDMPGERSLMHIWVTPKGNDRASVTVTEERLADGAAVEARRAVWRSHLDRLALLFRDTAVASHVRQAS